MANHISVRMAWHTDGWNGHICKDPKANTYCCGRYSYPGDVVARDKDLEWESNKEVCGKSCSKLDKAPPCSCSINAFGNDSVKTYQAPPVWFHDDSEGIYIDLPPATVCTWSYDAMYGEDVERNDGKGQKYDNDKRFENVKAYFSQIDEGKSLLFYYANYSNPYSSEDNNRYILIGIGKLKEKGDFHFYNNVSDRIKQRYANGLVWQYPLTSYWPQEGVRLPFHVYKDNPEIFDKLAITPDNPSVFKYATRILTDDDALSVIEKFITVVNYLKEIGDETENWDARLSWLYDITSELWKSRGPFPGLAKVLSVFDFKEGIEYLKNHSENQKEVLENIKNLLDGKTKTVKGLNIEEKSLSKLQRNWRLMEDDKKELLLSILPRFDLSKLQIKNIISDNRIDNGIYSSIEKICQNPYILSEQYHGDDSNDIISFNKIDNGILPSPDTGLTYFFDINSPERFRALCADTLKWTSEHSFLSGNLILNDINSRLKNYPESKQVEFKSKYYDVDKDFLNESLTIREHENVKYLYLKETWEDERQIEAIIKSFSQRGDIPLKTPVTIKFFENNLFKPESPINLRSEAEYRDAIKQQAEICSNIFNKPLCVISGAAGTGKTTIVKSLLAGIEKAGGQGTSFLLLAPTGKASQRLRESTEKESKTIHSLIASGGWLNDNFSFKRSGGKKEKSYSNIIIDECSMIDLSLMAALFRCIDWNFVERLILIGDPNQLPPIGRGRVFADIIKYLEDNNPDNLGKLEINLRMLESKVKEGGTGVLDLANIYIQEKQNGSASLKIKKEKILKRVQEGGEIDTDLSVYFWNDKDELEALIKDTIQNDLLKETKMDSESSTHDLWQAYCRKNSAYLDASVLQILSPARNGNFGVDYLNTYFQSIFNGKEFEKYSLGGITLGDKVMQIWNRTGQNKISAYDPDSREAVKETIFNGEIGFSFKHNFDTNQRYLYRLEKFTVRFDSRPGLLYNYGKVDGYFSESVEGNLELAYVLSIHKAQGSEFERVYLILPNSERRLLSMELLYTGITRASKHLTIFAEQDISCFTRLATIEKSNLKRINSSIFDFNPLPDGIIYPSSGNWYEESRKISTLSEYYVRSKSEMNIANILSLRNIPFEYEKPLFAKDGTMYLPDFTISYKGKTYFWEHIGRLDLPEYKKHWEEKEEWYNMFFPGQLIKTYESDNQTKDIENIINEKFA